MKTMNPDAENMCSSYEMGWQTALKNFEMYLAETGYKRSHLSQSRHAKKGAAKSHKFFI